MSRGVSWPGYLMVAAVTAVVVWLLVGYDREANVVHERVADTVTRYVWHEPVEIDRVVTQTVRSHDTVTRVDTIVRYMTPDSLYCAPAFVATLDSIVGGDTVRASFRYPDATLSVLIRQKPDTVRTVTITDAKKVYEQRAWWIDALTHVGAATLGYAVGRAR